MRNYQQLFLTIILIVCSVSVLAVEPVTVRHGSIPGGAQIVTNAAALYADATNQAASAIAQAHTNSDKIASVSSGLNATSTLLQQTVANLNICNAALNTHVADKSNPHAVTAAQVGAATTAALADEVTRATAAESAKQNTLTYDTDVNLRSIHTQYAQLDDQGNLTDLSSIHLSYGNSWESILSSAGVTLQSVLDGKASVDDLSSESAARVAGDLAATNHIIAATNALVAKIPQSPTGLVASATVAYSVNALSVALAAGGTLSANTANWPEGQAVMAFVTPAGAYTPSGLSLVGYAGWPTNAFQCAAWRYGTNVFVNIISTL